MRRAGRTQRTARLLLLGACFAVDLGGPVNAEPPVPAEMTADQSSAPDQLYAGRSVAEWQAWFKEIELEGRESIAAAPQLAELAGDVTVPPELRKQAALTLGRIRGAADDAVPVLRQLLAETSISGGERPRSWALKSIALLGAPSAELTPQVVSIVHDPATADFDRLLSLEALARIGPAHAATLSAIVRVLEHGAPAGAVPADDVDAAAAHLRRRTAAADVLSLFGPAGSPAIPALLQSARADDELLRRIAVLSLGTMRSTLLVDPLTDILLVDSSPAVQDAAAVALAQIGPAAVPIFEPLLSDADPATRARAADGLGRIGPAALSALGPLQTSLDDSAPEVRISAAEAVYRLSPADAPALDTALALLTEPQREVRMRAHRLIVAIGRESRDPTVVERLQTLADSRDPRVRQAAFQTLRELHQAP